jgi:hypothetical protein
MLGDTTKKGIGRALLLMTLVICLSACATGGPVYSQGFRFEANTTAQILDYAYGNNGAPLMLGTSNADHELMKEGRTHSVTPVNMDGYFGRREYLYVKWRDNASGQVFEEKVDLRDKIPRAPENYSLNFEVWGKNLWVYLFPPKKFKLPFDDESKSTFIPGTSENYRNKPMYENAHDRQFIIFQTHNE